jgi:site-specific DNA recombinase
MSKHIQKEQTPVRAAIYRRVSTRGQAREDHFSLDEQLERCTQRCREKGFEIVADLADIHSGSMLEERPQMSRLLDMMYGREIDVIVATTLDRLSRERNHLGVIHHIASKYRVAIELTEEVFEDAPTGQLLRSVSGFIAQIEREKIRERTRRGVRQRVRAGLMLPSGIPLYGYSFADNKKSRYIENPDTAPIVKRIWESAVAGESQGTIARKLTEAGIPTPRDYLRACTRMIQVTPHGAMVGHDPLSGAS